MIPSREQWEGAWEGLDTATAFYHFFGKSGKEARYLIEKAPELYCEDFMWMPRGPLKYYLPAFSEYLMSPSSKGDSYAAYSYLGLIKSRLSDQYTVVSELWEAVSLVLERLSSNQHFYDALMDEGVYSKLVS